MAFGYFCVVFLHLVIISYGYEKRDIDTDCYDRSCTSPSSCCSGFTCVESLDVYLEVSGHCLPTLGRMHGESCVRDEECAEGLECLYHDHRFSCQPQLLDAYGRRKKLFADVCHTSADCDVDAGMCCQVQKRHRMSSRKLCLYYDHPAMCIGKLGTNTFQDSSNAVSDTDNYIPYHKPWEPDYYSKYGKYSRFHRYY